MMSDSGRVIRRGFLRDFLMGFYNGVFQFISKIKPVVNITTILLRFALQCKLHTLTAQTFLSSYLLKTHVFKNEHNCFNFLVLGMDVCNLHCRTKRKCIVKLCLLVWHHVHYRRWQYTTSVATDHCWWCGCHGHRHSPTCGSRRIIQVDAAHWWRIRRDPPHPPTWS